MPEVKGQNILYLGGGVGFSSKTTHYQTKSHEQAKHDTFEILRKRFRGTYGKMKRIPQNVPVALKGTLNYSKISPINKECVKLLLKRMIDGGKVMKVLFSPIGNTDPWSNERDGAMLHIVRHYRPEKSFCFYRKYMVWE